MTPLLPLVTLWSTTAAAALVSATWQGLILSAAVAICLSRLPQLSASARSRLWMSVFLVVVLLHISPLAPLHTSSSATHPQKVLSVSPLWALAVAALWALLSLYGAARLVSSAARLHRIARQATPIDPGPACTALLRNSRRPVELCTSTYVDRPSVIGFRSPRILLSPTLLAQLSPSELDQVILHELEHLRRADDWTNLAQKLILTLFPLNPVLFWIERRLSTERELACDDAVLRTTGARKAYATCLAHLAEHSILRRGVSLALGAWERHSELSGRVYRILSQPQATLGATQAGIVSVLLALFVLAGAGELARTPQLVRFAPSAPFTAQNAPVQAHLAPAAFQQPAHLSLTRAVMPQNGTFARPAIRPAQAVLVRSSHRKRPGLPAVAHPRALAPAPWVVLTSWRQLPQPGAAGSPPHQVFWSSYAAVSVANGWLIIQL